jgi:hypothetical protein
LRIAGKGVQKGDNAGVSSYDSKSYGSGDGEANYKSNQQTSQDRPAFPSLSSKKRNGLSPVSHCCNHEKVAPRRLDRCAFTLPALTLAAVYN